MSSVAPPRQVCADRSSSAFESVRQPELPDSLTHTPILVTAISNCAQRSIEAQASGNVVVHLSSGQQLQLLSHCPIDAPPKHDSVGAIHTQTRFICLPWSPKLSRCA